MSQFVCDHDHINVKRVGVTSSSIGSLFGLGKVGLTVPFRCLCGDMPRHVSLVFDEVVLTSRSAKHGRIRCNVRSLFLIEWNCSFTELAFALNSCHLGTLTLEIAEVSFCDLRFTTNFSHFSDGARQPHSDYEVITNFVIRRYHAHFSFFRWGETTP